ncbi:menaquinone-specific isochorismate synthase [Rubritalea squalenifaciens DSM 18772]|uniref:Menaquinone-specific isochorismate synthase n=1 Tax=Rubritalea squalenifaciens DSM 18772 TaxID=1123071 RepID=A0A1M6HLC3_9BACT|nr:menaquinone-specific isochorismate synthase [Rubritalea squalenifaciens DSM 18772]
MPSLSGLEAVFFLTRKAGVDCLDGMVLIQAMDLSGRDFALLGVKNGRVRVGLGPFSEAEECPREGVAFYVNDFQLSDSRPWRIPSEVVELSLEDLSQGDLEVDWQEMSVEGFAGVFTEIGEAIQRGIFEKSVPVVTEMGKITAGCPVSLIGKLAGAGESFYPYAWVHQGKGFCGLTPELLLHLRKGRLKTMALAGTAKADEKTIFAFDEKEIREHEYVAQTLVASLSDIGMVKRSTRRVMNLGSLVHFHTPIEVFMYGDYPLEYLVRKMHPTPALGPLPRTEETMSMLVDWRKRLGCPAYFGAPFGIFDHGEFHAVVMIRGIHWSGEEIMVPSGCGVIEASRLTNEWRELGLKRDAIKQRFSI